MTPSLLATLRAAGEAATKAPWYRGRRIISAGIEPPGLPELKGTGKCALCHPSRPLHSVVPNGYHSEYTGKTADLHRHIDPNPSGADSKIQSEDGDQVAGAFDYDDGGIVNPADAAFIALARNHWGELLDEIERLTEQRDGWAHQYNLISEWQADTLNESAQLKARLLRDLENAEIRREHAEKRAREYLLKWQEDPNSRADVLEAAIDENLPEYVLDDGTDEPANYLERIEYAGRDARK